MGKNESNRQYDLIDQLMSMHAFLCDKYKRRALILNIGLLVVSVFLCALVFADNAVLILFGVTSNKAKIGLGFLSIICFAISLIEYRVDWKGQAALHLDAVSKLATLKAEFRETYAKFKGENEGENKLLSQKYNDTMNNIISIPEALFVILKSRHLSKKILSQKVSECPGAPIFLLRLTLWYSGVRKVFSFKKKAH